MARKLANCGHTWARLSAAGALLLVLLAGCASQPSQSERYEHRHDRGPENPPDLSQVADAVPTHEPLSVGGNRSPYTVWGKTYHVLAQRDGYREEGIASWYGVKFHGHRTANGEVYDMYAMSAAHRSLPLPSYVRVTNLENQRSVVVRVNDRGPFHKDRLIDLSYAAAYRLGFHRQGTARVRVEVVEPTADAPVKYPPVYLQVAALSNAQAAARLQQRLSTLLALPVRIDTVTRDLTMHRVRVGPLREPQQVEEAIRRIEAARLGRPLVLKMASTLRDSCTMHC